MMPSDSGAGEFYRQKNQPINIAAEHETALKEIAGLMSAELGTPEGNRLDLLSALVEAYDGAEHFPIT